MRVLLYVDKSWKNYKLFEFVLNEYFPKWHWWFRKLEFISYDFHKLSKVKSYCNKYFIKNKQKNYINHVGYKFSNIAMFKPYLFDKVLIFSNNKTDFEKKRTQELIDFCVESKTKYETFFEDSVTYVQKSSK